MVKFQYVLGNSSGDMDSIISVICLAKSLVNGIPILNIPKNSLYLRKDVCSLLKKDDEFYYVDDLPKLLNEQATLTLVDHNLAEEWICYVVRVIDHHVDENLIYPNLKEKIIAKTGSCATLVSEYIFEHGKMTKELAYLLLAPILLDTMNLADPRKTTMRDIAAFEKLAKFGVIPNFAELLKKRLDVEGLSPTELLNRDFKAYQKNDYSYGIASLPKGVEWTDANQNIWETDLIDFAEEKQLKTMIILEWIGEDKWVILYPEIKLIQLKEPLARKELQPLIHKVL